MKVKKLKKKLHQGPKEEIIKRLLAKADLDFRCCGHGPDRGIKKK